MLNKKALLLYITRNALLVFFVLLFSVGIIIFLKSRIEKIQITLQENQRVVRSLEKRGETIAQLRKQFESIQTSDELIIASFPYSDDILAPIQKIDSLSQIHGIQIVKQFGTPTAFMTTTNGVHISTIPFSLSAQGTISAISSFLSEIESLPYFISVTSLTIQSNESWTQTSNISLSGNIYTQERK